MSMNQREQCTNEQMASKECICMNCSKNKAMKSNMMLKSETGISHRQDEEEH